jgi:gamma-glutamylcyclotransferase (GGCT)/AIG2-like uncharacterized protein YtfP
MSDPHEATENLFTYGTLQKEDVQLATFGRTWKGKRDTLAGYRLRAIVIQDQDFVATSGTANHLNIQATGAPSDSVEGMVFKVTPKELEQADAYEPEGYGRVLVQLQSGISAWLYINKSQQ